MGEKMDKNCLNKYVHIVDNGHNYILFNTYNESIVTIDKPNLRGNILLNLKQNELNYLTEKNFFQDSTKLLDEYLKKRSLQAETLSITISLTQGCNLACSYCSQNNAKDRLIISDKVLDNIIEYIKNRMISGKYRFLAVSFFGGEPLLAKEKILYFKNNLEKYVDINIISYSIVTNGILLDSEFLENFGRINVKVTLTEKKSHDKFRVFKNGHGSYDIIFKNLKNIAKYFKVHKNARLSLRYNVDNLKNNFFDFVQSITKELPYIKYIEIAPVYNFEFNKKTSYFTKQEFTKFYLKALEVMLKSGLLVEFPTTRTAACKAYSKDGIKIFADGGINLCNGCDCNLRRSNISYLIETDSKQRIYKDLMTGQLPQKCLDCSLLFLCSGIQLCKPNQCNFLTYDLDEFLKFYVKIIEKDEKYFDQFYTSEFNYD